MQRAEIRRNSGVAPHQHGSAIYAEKTRTETQLSDRIVIMSGIAGPARHEPQRNGSSICHAMSRVWRNEVQTASPHHFHARLAILIHQDKRAVPFGGSVIFCPVALQVKVTVSHKELRAYLAGFDHRASPKLRAFSSFRD